MGITLGANQYGKAENRVVRIYRDTERHEIRDLNVSHLAARRLRATRTSPATRATVLPTDTQKNTAFAFAKETGIDSPEEYGLTLGGHFLDAHRRRPRPGSGSRSTPGSGSRSTARGTTTRSCGAARRSAPRGDHRRRPRASAASGWSRASQDLVVLKSTGSEFKGFLTDKYTTLQETDDRVMATSLTARWRYEARGRRADWDATYDDIKRDHALGVRTTYTRGPAADALRDGQRRAGGPPRGGGGPLLGARTSTTSWSTSPRSACENNDEVFIAADRPYGLIEASVVREGGSDPGDAWLITPGFCRRTAPHDEGDMSNHARLDTRSTRSCPRPKLAVYGFQHVLAFYAGAVIVPILLPKRIGLTSDQLIHLINADLFTCGIASIIQSVGFWKIGCGCRCCRASRSPRSPR